MSDDPAFELKVSRSVGPPLITRAGNIEGLHLMHEPIAWGEKGGFRETDGPKKVKGNFPACKQ